MASNLQVVSKQVGDVILKNSPTILTGLAVGGVITTVILTVGATKRALEVISEEQVRQYVQNPKEKDKPLQKKEIVRLTWKCYIPTVIMGIGTIACIISSNSINLHRNAALASIYAIAETSLKEYQQKILETIGEKKELKLREEMDQDKLDRDPVEGKQVIVTGRGETLCYDSLSGRYFNSDLETIRRIQNDFNHQLNVEMYLTLNEFYDELGLEHTELGNNIGWTTEYGLVNIVFSAKIATDGRPCIVLNYAIGPRKL